jgi:GMP synthase-like glutamine amidotransferase
VRVLSIVHEREAGSGVFATAAADWGAELAEWIPAEAAAPSRDAFAAVLVFGGAMHVDQERQHQWLSGEKQLLRAFLAERVPLLGVCLGAQLLAEVAGGDAKRSEEPEIGWTSVKLTSEAGEDPLLGPMPSHFSSFEWHSYELSPPDGATVLARTAACVQAFRLQAAPAWGIQFHAEATGETIAGWIRDYRADEDAVRADLDWAALLAQTEQEIPGSNELGAGICKRFLDRAAASGPVL